MKRQSIAAIALCSLLISSLVFLGCEVGSSDSATRNMGVNFSGFYDAVAGGSDFVTPANSGARVTSLNLRQTGDQLEAIDNNNIVFSGTLNDVSEDSGNATAGFTLEGRTTAGSSVTIAGSLSGSGSTAEMRGTWIEPGMYAYVLGDATINAIPTNSGTSYSFAWTVSPSGAGSVSPSSGSSYSAGSVITVIATASGTNKFTGWTGDLTSTNANTSLTMNSSKSVVAHFNNQ